MLRNKNLIVEFSGGKDSTALLINLLEKGYEVDKAVRVDFGTEFKEMYDVSLWEMKLFCKSILIRV